ncbi:DNA binding methylated-DNA--cysteine S-methyltransferase [Paxillus ammoniavirescens]|nr:DNA binding methylated-DNA--cysteine S-methyltransferase [Paxillus ammoniavirescens]
MPAVRARTKLVLSKPANVAKTRKEMVGVNKDPQDLSICSIEYPVDNTTRSKFRTTDGKKVTPHQWAVYDFARTIPCGRVTTYKDLCLALGQGSPRSVGSALRNNPFAPFVPCHRIIASNLYIGGFYGEWGTGDNSKVKAKGEGGKNTGRQCRKKVEMLATEGVGFTEGGYLVDEGLIWRG